MHLHASSSGSVLFVSHNYGVDLPLKGPKREIFVAGIFAQIRPVWIGDLGTRPKNKKKYVWGLKFHV